MLPGVPAKSVIQLKNNIGKFCIIYYFYLFFFHKNPEICQPKINMKKFVVAEVKKKKIQIFF